MKNAYDNRNEGDEQLMCHQTKQLISLVGTKRPLLDPNSIQSNLHFFSYGSG